MSIDPAQYVVAGGTVGAFGFIVKLVTRYQGSVTSVAFDRIDKLEKDLMGERARCDALELKVRDTEQKLWKLQGQLDRYIQANDAANRSNDGLNRNNDDANRNNDARNRDYDDRKRND